MSPRKYFLSHHIYGKLEDHFLTTGWNPVAGDTSEVLGGCWRAMVVIPREHLHVPGEKGIIRQKLHIIQCHITKVNFLKNAWNILWVMLNTFKLTREAQTVVYFVISNWNLRVCLETQIVTVLYVKILHLNASCKHKIHEVTVMTKKKTMRSPSSVWVTIRHFLKLGGNLYLFIADALAPHFTRASVIQLAAYWFNNKGTQFVWQTSSTTSLKIHSIFSPIFIL